MEARQAAEARRKAEKRQTADIPRHSNERTKRSKAAIRVLKSLQKARTIRDTARAKVKCWRRWGQSEHVADSENIDQSNVESEKEKRPSSGCQSTRSEGHIPRPQKRKIPGALSGEATLDASEPESYPMKRSNKRAKVESYPSPNFSQSTNLDSDKQKDATYDAEADTQRGDSPSTAPHEAGSEQSEQQAHGANDAGNPQAATMKNEPQESTPELEQNESELQSEQDELDNLPLALLRTQHFDAIRAIHDARRFFTAERAERLPLVQKLRRRHNVLDAAIKQREQSLYGDRAANVDGHHLPCSSTSS
ncbi:hypothetical protein BT63DRAFT_456777 [Microthyrium microscopicum]|uniref:Uncharacterized protein n=1 Tax=Microthyrium microscopicum TaxID=703497 RepID=A0A6A6U7B5_9PEZI|nr:hypothetical protein BT63DRAFT_456777 [Microthyrium microscopicum]